MEALVDDWTCESLILAFVASLATLFRVRSSCSDAHLHVVSEQDDGGVAAVSLPSAVRGIRCFSKCVHHAVSRLPSLTSFCILVSISPSYSRLTRCPHTNAFSVPCSACLWFLRNLGSVPLREGYLCDFGFLMLFLDTWSAVVPSLYPEIS